MVPKLLLEVCNSSLEFIHAAARVNKLLLAREERMALGANVNSLLAAFGGHGLNDLAASAPDDALFVLGVDSLFHVRFPRFINLMFFDIIPQNAADRNYTADRSIIPQMKPDCNSFCEKNCENHKLLFRRLQSAQSI